MATCERLIDAASADSDLLITFSTPTLQAALQRVNGCRSSSTTFRIRSWPRRNYRQRSCAERDPHLLIGAYDR
jgi:hypothetical protein